MLEDMTHLWTLKSMKKGLFAAFIAVLLAGVFFGLAVPGASYASTSVFGAGNSNVPAAANNDDDDDDHGGNGNNGTVKIHDADTDDDDNRNEPKVCRFYLAGFKFDKNQRGTWRIVGHSPTAGNRGLSGNWGAADNNGNWRTTVMTLSDGHYKLTVDTGKGAGKHKVFWVDCKDKKDKDKDHGQGKTCPSGMAILKDHNDIRINIKDMKASVSFTIVPGCEEVVLSLVSYKAPSATFSRESASQQKLHDFETRSLSSGQHKMTVDIPDCYYQVDFVFGHPIQQLGPANSNNFYSDQGRLIEGVLGGTKVCAQAQATPTPAPTSTPTAVPATATPTLVPNTPTPTMTVGPGTPTPIPPTATATLVPNTPTPTMTVGLGTPTPIPATATPVLSAANGTPISALETPTSTPPAVVGLPPTGGSSGSGGGLTLAVLFTLISGIGAAALGLGIRAFGIRGS